MSRPALPERHINQRLKLIDVGSLPPVKYQILTCQGQDILVGRMKIATPTGSGHAFILRRFDTGAISLTTMFRAAFPEASDIEEKRETAWVKENFDLSGNNGSSKEHSIVRLAGTWVSPKVALALADSYHLGSVIPAIAEATPDPNVTYRRSGKGAAGSEAPVTPAGSLNLMTSSPNTAPSAAKRRKESSPQLEPESSVPRRSTRPRSKSPAASSVLSPARKSNRAPKTPKTSNTTVRRAAAPVTPRGSDEAAADEDTEMVEGLGQDMFQEDVAEQRDLIAKLKSRRGATSERNGDQAKRAREDQEYPTQLNLKEPEVGERAIASNRRVGRFYLEPRQRSFAWGVAAFAFGLGAVTLLPNFM